MKVKLVRFLYILASLTTVFAQICIKIVLNYIFNGDYISALFNIMPIWIFGFMTFLLLRGIEKLEGEIKKDTQQSILFSN
ncbi:hypothetical protein DVK85_11745 [Flavobacterium arcticum]|uniref:Uncharacterized protein n=1 Tax=Flavobacterium arcticum TaxID=1784713 RepID=A0A345HE53_9FLAO|nr:hypothetical protein DVK85_11745 [Flavobacterium arcticum]